MDSGGWANGQGAGAAEPGAEAPQAQLQWIGEGGGQECRVQA